LAPQLFSPPHRTGTQSWGRAVCCRSPSDPGRWSCRDTDRNRSSLESTFADLACSCRVCRFELELIKHCVNFDILRRACI
jgi:hypothetical protein